jgi:DNA recombination protein RmuC
MGRMENTLIAVLLVALGAAACAVLWLVAQRRRQAAEEPRPVALPPEVVSQLVAQAVGDASERAGRERDAAVRAAVEHAVVTMREQLGAHTQAADRALAGRQELIDQRLTQVQSGVQTDMQRLSELVRSLGSTTAEKFGKVDESLRAHTEVTNTLAATAGSLREALASSNTRGQWGERMAEDVLRLAGFQEGTNYVKRKAVEGDGSGIPDFTFRLPKGHVLLMDVKFPMAAYLRFLDAGTEAERSAHRAAFVRDVRARVRELAKRDYAATDDRPAVDNVLMFVPNESIAAFIHEADSSLIDEAMRSNVVICSPLTLFAFLGVIRQAFDNFVLEQTSKEILQLLGRFEQQWGKYSEAVDKVKRSFETLNRSFDELAGTRRTQLAKPLKAIDDLRRRQQLPRDGELFSIDANADADDGEDELFGNVRELGA